MSHCEERETTVDCKLMLLTTVNETLLRDKSLNPLDGNNSLLLDYVLLTMQLHGVSFLCKSQTQKLIEKLH
jgi:hypothetical protein